MQDIKEHEVVVLEDQESYIMGRPNHPITIESQDDVANTIDPSRKGIGSSHVALHAVVQHLYMSSTMLKI